MVCSGYMCYFDASFSGYNALPPNLQWLTLAVLATFVVVIIHGLLLGIARAFSLNELERYAKAELLNAVASVVMVALLVWMVGAAEKFAIDYFFGSGGMTFKCGGNDIGISQLSSSLELLKCRLSEKAADFAEIHGKVTEAATGPANPFNRLSIYFSLIGVPIFQGNMLTSWFKEAEDYRLINHIITTLLIGLNAMIVLVDYVKNNMLSVYLPIGLILRSFHFTRGIGAFFIAMGIGFYFIFPILYIITDPGYVKPTYNPPAVPSTQPLCVPTFSGTVHSIYGQASGGAAASGMVEFSLNQLKNDVGGVYASIVIQPFVVFAITIVFVRYMMTILGGEAQDLMRGIAKLV